MQQVAELLQTGVYETLKVDSEKRVSDLLKELELECKYFGILVNGKKADEDTIITPKDNVVILPHIAGGI